MVVLMRQHEGKKPKSPGEEFTNVEDIGVKVDQEGGVVLPMGVPRPIRYRALGQGKSKKNR